MIPLFEWRRGGLALNVGVSGTQRAFRLIFGRSPAYGVVAARSPQGDFGISVPGSFDQS
jgi:hypothetical protein